MISLRFLFGFVVRVFRLHSIDAAFFYAYVDIPWSVCLFVYLFVITVNPAIMDKPIEMQLGIRWSDMHQPPEDWVHIGVTLRI